MLLIFCECLWACKYGPQPNGTIATVNDEPINLHSVQALMDSRSAALGIPPHPSLAEMQDNYAEALKILIIHTLVRQELANHGLGIEDQDLNDEIERVKEDFGSDSLNDYLVDSSLREEDWRNLTRDYLALEKFKNKILLPGIKIDLNDIREYYTDHKDDFILPDNLRICFITAQDRDSIESWCAKLPLVDNSSETLAQCLNVQANEVPQPWNNEIKKLKIHTCAKIINEQGEWQTVGLLQREKQQRATLPESYALIENILIKQKQESAFNKWLEQKLAKSKILIAPELKRSFVFDNSEITGQQNSQNTTLQ